MDSSKNTILKKYDDCDTSLQLRVLNDNGIMLSREEALGELMQSKIINRLTNEIIEKPLFYVWRLIALSEIPYTIHLDYTKKLIDRIYNRLSTPYGFSLSGNEKMFLPCYNAMIVSALSRLGRSGDIEVKQAVDWIMTYQPMERGVQVSIPNLKFDKYGGCFNNTPCYIGLAKSVMALIEYKKDSQNNDVNDKITKGAEYILMQNLFKRFKTGNPITGRILDISFPESYHLNIVELVRIIKEAKYMNDERTGEAVALLLGQRQKDGKWKINYRYKADGYLVFDQGSKSGDWVSYIINQAIEKEINNRKK
jgi:hypothetical protein